MKLDELTNYQKDLGRVKLLYGVITLCAVLALPVMHYVYMQKLAEATANPLVSGPDYKMFKATRRELTSEERRYQFEDHAKIFWEQLWTVDKSNMDAQVDLAMEKAGVSAENVFKEYYVEKGLERNIKESNWTSELRVLECVVRMDTIPHTGIIRSRWQINRLGGNNVRHLDFTFSIKDYGISPQNQYGAEVNDINIFDNSKFEENNE